MLEKIKQFVIDRQATLISGLSALLIIVLGFLLFSYFSQINKQTAPKQTIQVEDATKSGQLTEATRSSIFDRESPKAEPRKSESPKGAAVAKPEEKKPEAATETKTYTVSRGDSLSIIAQKFYGDASKYTLIANEKVNNITNPDLIHAGNTFTIPSLSIAATTGASKTTAALPASGIVFQNEKQSNKITLPTTHTVISGDTLWSLAEKYYNSGFEWFRIHRVNQDKIGILPDNTGRKVLITPGEHLTIPTN